MATGASTADLAVLLVDARKGVLTQTRRHAIIVSLLGIRHVVLAVNKMDLVGFDAGAFDAIDADFAGFAANARLRARHAIPMSARFGDNVTRAERRACPGTRADAARASRDASTSTTSRSGAAVPLAGAMGQPAEPRFPRLCRHHRRRPRQARRRDRGRRRPAARSTRRAHRHHDGDSTSACRARR